MKNELEIIAKSEFCKVRKCPTLYKGRDGNYYVQGFSVKDAGSLVPELPENELIVRVDASLIEQIKKCA
jgi:hypothetical protein